MNLHEKLLDVKIKRLEEHIAGIGIFKPCENHIRGTHVLQSCLEWESFESARGAASHIELCVEAHALSRAAINLAIRTLEEAPLRTPAMDEAIRELLDLQENCYY